MRYFYVGLAMRDRTHDYRPVHAALFAMQAHRVSVRIWFCSIEQGASDTVFGHMARSLSPHDELLIVEAPREARMSRQTRAAA